MRWMLFFLLISSPAVAGFIDSKVRWDSLSIDGKHGYAMGYFDGFMTKVLDDDDMNFYKDDLLVCVNDLEFLSTQLVAIIDKGYEDIGSWSKGPSTVLMAGLRTVCLDKMNDRRLARGATPLAP